MLRLLALSVLPAAAGSTLNASRRSILAVARSLYLSMLVLSCEMTRGYLRNCEMGGGAD